MAIELTELGALYIDLVEADSDASTPVLINRNPEPDETDVPASTVVYLEIVDIDVFGIDVWSTEIWIDDVLAFKAVAFQTGFDGPQSATVLTADTYKIRIDPTSDFASLATVTIRVLAQTLASMPLDETYFFEIEDLTAPSLVSAEARSQTVIRLSFDEAMLQEDSSGASDALNPSQYTFAAQNSDTEPAVPIVATGVASYTSTAVDVTVDIPMTPGVQYQVTVAEAEDLWGNRIDEAYATALFTGFSPAQPTGRVWDLWRKMPGINKRLDETQDLLRFIRCLQEVSDLLLVDIDRWWKILDLDLAPESFVDAMLYDTGNPFSFLLTLTQKRKLLRILLEIYKLKGTAKGIINVVRFFLGIEITKIDAYNETTMSLGESELGVDWFLGIDSSFARFSFDVYVDRVLTVTQRQQIRDIVEYMKPAHTHFIRLIEPGDPEHVDHWSLGESELGVSTLLHE